MSSNFTTISLNKKLAEKIDEYLEDSTFSNRKDYIAYLIRKDLEDKNLL